MERVAQVFLAKWELSGEESFRKRLLGFLFRMAGRTITLSPTFPSPGMATLFSAVSWREITTPRISSKFLPVVAG